MHIRFSRRVAFVGPTLLTTLGIAFCFFGIALGLLDFDANNIKESIPSLIDGIRTAFWVSVVGIFAAITIKLRVFFFGDPAIAPGTNQPGHTLSDLAQLLVQLNRSIAGGEDSALISQTKLMRTDNNDRLDQLQRSFREFAQTMAEANSKALIQALSEIIRDFNSKLTEQFGENFKQLNSAVEKLVLWQGQYKDQMVALIDQETQTRKTMTEASLRYAELVGKSQVFVQTTQALHELLTGLVAQRAALETSLKALAELVNKAGDGLPKIETQIIEMTRHIEAGVRANNDLLTATMKTVAQGVQASQTQFSQVLNDGLTKANQQVNSHITQTSEKLTQQVTVLDAALERELTRSIETLGRQLAALSQKFVQDYTPLTESLRTLMQSLQRR
jgi:DNA anti-recombination protein RmuC